MIQRLADGCGKGRPGAGRGYRLVHDFGFPKFEGVSR